MTKRGGRNTPPRPRTGLASGFFPAQFALVNFRKRMLIALLSVALAAGTAALEQNSLPAPATQRVDFDRDIAPIFREHCIECHGPKKQKSALNASFDSNRRPRKRSQTIAPSKKRLVI